MLRREWISQQTDDEAQKSVMHNRLISFDDVLRLLVSVKMRHPISPELGMPEQLAIDF